LQVERVREVRRNRDGEAVRRSLARLATEAADPEINLMPALIEAAQNYVTVGESMATLAQVFGRYVETASI
jgi:methylmalonyl-CoA mutase N-terminal domain/subunit